MVPVTIAARRQNTYSILGAIASPAIYSVTSKDMRLLEALAMARGVTQTNIQYIYVFRQAPPEREAKVEPTKITPESLPELPPEAPGEPEPVEQTEDAALQELEKVMCGPAKTKPAEPQPLPAGQVGERTRPQPGRRGRIAGHPGRGPQHALLRVGVRNNEDEIHDEYGQVEQDHEAPRL